MPPRRLTWLDVFTSTPLAGNGLAVVHDADDLDDATMLRVARETNLSETTFVQAPTGDGADYRVRIFTIAGEIPFAGHPSLGTAVAVARERGETQARFTQETAAGRQPLEVAVDGDRAHASMLQEPAEFGAAVDAGPVLGALGLGPGDGHPELPVQPVSTGLRHLMVPLRDDVALARAQPSLARVRTIAGATQAMALYAFVPGPDATSVCARGFFDANNRVVEDPATGSAAGPLCAYLHHHLGSQRVTVTQGVELGRASRLETSIADGRVRVAGECVVVLEGRLSL